MNRLSNVLVFLVAVTTGAFSMSVRAGEETSKHRIIGLSDPDREKDLRDVVKTMPEVELVSLDINTTEAAFKYDVAKLLTNYNPKKPPAADAVTKRLDDLLKNASHNTFSLKTLSTVPADKLKKEEIPVGVLDCKGCRYGAYLAVAKIEGVERATVSSEKALLTAWIDSAKTNRAALEDALKKAHIDQPVH
jgi:hypothetical protein